MTARRKKPKRIGKPEIFIIIGMVVLVIAVSAANYWNMVPKKSYDAADFGIKIIKSDHDQNHNGVDDYTDILLGARAYVETNPKYESGYYQGGYPPDGIGVCTDVIWEAFQSAGYNLKDLVDQDIAAHPEAYTGISAADPNIDFRRVKNLAVFFARNAQSLTTDISDIESWQPGDIVVYTKHIAIISDKRDENGRPYIIHNAGQPILEEDALTRYTVVGHYRWNGIVSE